MFFVCRTNRTDTETETCFPDYNRDFQVSAGYHRNQGASKPEFRRAQNIVVAFSITIQCESPQTPQCRQRVQKGVSLQDFSDRFAGAHFRLARALPGHSEDFRLGLWANLGSRGCAGSCSSCFSSISSSQRPARGRDEHRVRGTLSAVRPADAIFGGRRR